MAGRTLVDRGRWYHEPVNRSQTAGETDMPHGG